MAYIYMITYPNGKIYIGAYWHRKRSKSYSERDGMFTYFGSPTLSEHISNELSSYGDCFTITKEVLYRLPDPETSESKEEKNLLKKEKELILKYQANNPRIGYNLRPKFTELKR